MTDLFFNKSKSNKIHRIFKIPPASSLCAKLSQTHPGPDDEDLTHLSLLLSETVLLKTATASVFSAKAPKQRVYVQVAAPPSGHIITMGSKVEAGSPETPGHCRSPLYPSMKSPEKTDP